MWCARIIKLKHPELAIQCAEKLKTAGYSFQLDMYGEGQLRSQLELLIKNLKVDDIVKLHGNVPNAEIHKAMNDCDVFLCTSDRNEGWGAVVNEAMSNGCVVVGGSKIGAVPFLIKDGINGMIFEDGKIDSLYEKVKFLFDNYDMITKLSKQAREDMAYVWSPTAAARNLLTLIEDLKSGHETTLMEGPCSKAFPIN